MINTPLAAPLGGPGDWEAELQALLDAYARGWDARDTSQNYAEVEALALGVAMIWAVNRRVEGQLVPLRMLETLPTWEAACNLRPLPTATLAQRRAAVAARFLGFAGNTLAQLWDVCVAMAGSAFLGFASLAPTDATSYQSGLNPGPPGFDWSSNRAVLGVQLTRAGLPDATFFDLMRRLRVELHGLCPSWMTFCVGTAEGGCVPDVGIPDVTLI